MIPELGHYALILAFCIALAQSILPLSGIFLQKPAWMYAARALAYGQCLYLSMAFAALAYAFLANDFSVVYVAHNSNSHLPAIYRFCAVWGAHEGSLLLWVCLLSIWTMAVARFSRSLPEEVIACILSVLGWISMGFLLFLLCTSNPFLRFLPNSPSDGADLNPLLQDPGLISHPPMLYMGYVGFAVAFAFAITALLHGKFPLYTEKLSQREKAIEAWAGWTKPWTLLAWCFLTFGIILGSYWAYRELGWGGWWFWDPVENASFLPWLSGTALVHSLMVTKKKNAFIAWTLLLAIVTFSLSLLGTFIVRSGVLISVHAFAVDPSRGIFMLVFLATVIGVSLSLYAWRIQRIHSTALPFSLFSRQGLFLSNNMLLTASMLTILLGTLYPLIVDAYGLEKISVGPPYFNIVFLPFMSCILFFMGIAPFSRWKIADNVSLLKKLGLTCVLAFVLAAFLPWIYASHLAWGMVFGLGLALWVILATLQSILRRSTYFFTVRKLSLRHWGMVLAHIGVAVCTIGITLVSYESIQKEVAVVPGDVVDLGAYHVKFIGTHDLVGPNYTGTEGEVQVTENDRFVALLKPQQRMYTVQKMALGKTAIDATVFRDIYIALGEKLEGQAWSLRVYKKPFVRWIWGGGLFMVLGGLFAFLGNLLKNKKKRKKYEA
jgi:cytochrome c-type biogenesis protein CcmF